MCELVNTILAYYIIIERNNLALGEHDIHATLSVYKHPSVSS